MRHRNKDGRAREEVWAKNKYSPDTREIIASCCMTNHQFDWSSAVGGKSKRRGCFCPGVFLFCWSLVEPLPQFPQVNMVTAAHGVCSWNWRVWIQWCVDTEDNYYLCSALDAGLSPWGYAVPGWVEVVPERLLWISVGSPAQDLPAACSIEVPWSFCPCMLPGTLVHSAGPCHFACSGVDTWSPGQRPWAPASWSAGTV